jgi:hypothetical protein
MMFRDWKVVSHGLRIIIGAVDPAPFPALMLTVIQTTCFP